MPAPTADVTEDHADWTADTTEEPIETIPPRIDAPIETTNPAAAERADPTAWEAMFHAPEKSPFSMAEMASRIGVTIAWNAFATSPAIPNENLASSAICCIAGTSSASMACATRARRVAFTGARAGGAGPRIVREGSVARPGRARIHAAEHRMIYEAIVAGDADAAAFYSTQHINRVRTYMELS